MGSMIRGQQPKGSHMARIHTLPQKEKEEAIGLIKKWLEE